MKTLSYWAAKGMFLAHIALGIFFLVGWMFKDIQFIYLPLLIAWPLSGALLGYCPLTKWEWLLRKKYKPSTDTNAGFIQVNMHKYCGIHVPRQHIRPAIYIAFVILLALSIVHNFL
jgi:hypothetical protein